MSYIKENRNDKDYKIALKATGDEIMAAKLLKWLRSSKGKRHRRKIKKIHRKHCEPKRVSQVFFKEREMGVTHEKHIGIKIRDHKASGELLLSYITLNS